MAQPYPTIEKIREEFREKIKSILVETCGQACTNGSENDYRAVNKIVDLFTTYGDAVREEMANKIKKLQQEVKDGEENNDYVAANIMWNGLKDILSSLEKNKEKGV